MGIVLDFMGLLRIYGKSFYDRMHSAASRTSDKDVIFCLGVGNHFIVECGKRFELEQFIALNCIGKWMFCKVCAASTR